MPIAEHACEFSFEQAPRKPLPQRSKGRCIVNVVFQPACMIIFRNDAMRMLKSGKGTCDLDILKLDAGNESPMLSDPRLREGPDVDTEFHLRSRLERPAGTDEFDPFPRGCQPLQRSRSRVPVKGERSRNRQRCALHKPWHDAFFKVVFTMTLQAQTSPIVDPGAQTFLSVQPVESMEKTGSHSGTMPEIHAQTGMSVLPH